MYGKPQMIVAWLCSFRNSTYSLLHWICDRCLFRAMGLHGAGGALQSAPQDELGAVQTRTRSPQRKSRAMSMLSRWVSNGSTHWAPMGPKSEKNEHLWSHLSWKWIESNVCMAWYESTHCSSWWLMSYYMAVLQFHDVIRQLHRIVVQLWDFLWHQETYRRGFFAPEHTGF